MHTGRFFLCPSLFVFVFLAVCFPYWLSPHFFTSFLIHPAVVFFAILQDDSLFGPDHKIIYRPPAIFCIVPELALQTQTTEERSVPVPYILNACKCTNSDLHVMAYRPKVFFWREDTFAESSLRARHFATLYFIFVADSAESELGVLDLIQASANSFVTFAYFSARREDYIMQCLNQSVTNPSRN